MQYSLQIIQSMACPIQAKFVDINVEPRYDGKQVFSRPGIVQQGET
jgi:hypothetical protein